MSDRWWVLLALIGLAVGVVYILVGGDKVDRYDNLRFVKNRKVRSALVKGRQYYMIVFLVVLLFLIAVLVTGRLEL